MKIEAVNRDYFNYMSIKDENSIKKHFLIFKKERPKPRQKILDLGCANGLFLSKCDEIGLETFGIDISKNAIGNAKRVTKANLFSYDLNKKIKMFNSNYFDFITMFDVIEHLDSPYSILKETYRLLKPNGKVIITTPNLNSISRIIFGSEWYGFKDKTHKHLFTKERLKQLVSESGFEVIKIETPFHKFSNIIQKVINKTGLGGQIWLVSVKEA